jgi:hypothetical protein
LYSVVFKQQSRKVHMNQKLRATGMVAGMLAISVSSLLLIKLAVTYIGAEMAPAVLGVIALVFLLYILYRIALSQIQYEDTLKDLGKK